MQEEFENKLTISIHSLRVEGDYGTAQKWASGEHISIHSLRVEGDLFPKIFSFLQRISIHSLRVEGD